MRNDKQTFDGIYARELSKERESDLHTKVLLFFGLIIAPLLAIFVHPAWLIATVLAGLAYKFHKLLHGGRWQLSGPAARQACEYMIAVRQSGQARSLLPLASLLVMIRLALSEEVNNKQPGPGARIVTHLRVNCAHCSASADPAFLAAWWQAETKFKKFPPQEKFLKPDGTCAQCGATEGWFESDLCAGND